MVTRLTSREARLATQLPTKPSPCRLLRPRSGSTLAEISATVPTLLINNHAGHRAEAAGERISAMSGAFHQKLRRTVQAHDAHE
eukprot:320878-Prymnesium_polylepis.1